MEVFMSRDPSKYATKICEALAAAARQAVEYGQACDFPQFGRLGGIRIIIYPDGHFEPFNGTYDEALAKWQARKEVKEQT